MSIESRIPTEEINLKELSLDAPEQKIKPFDADKEILPEDWEKIKVDFERIRKNNTWPDLVRFGAHLKILNPNLSLGLTVEDWESIKFNLESITTSPLEMGSNIKIVNPNFNTLSVLKIKDDFERLQKTFHTNQTWSGVLANYFRMKTVNPAFNSTIPESDWNNIMQELNSNLQKAKDNGRWDKVLFIIKYAKILDPDFNFELSAQDWEGIRKKIASQRKRMDLSTASFVSLVADAKIAAADKVIFTSNSFQLQNTPPSISEKPPLPEIKKF